MADIKIIGEGRSQGGHFQKVKVVGTGRITSELHCEQVKLFGEGKFEGNTSVSRFTMFGSVSMKQSLKAKLVKVYGKLEVEETFQSEIAKIKGWTNVDGDVSVEKLDVTGGLKIKGLLNVGQLTMNLQHEPSKINEIGGEKITIKSRSLNPFRKSQRLDVHVIEGDKIYLEHTTAKIVRGNEVTIGPHCEIEHVEYKTTLKKDNKSTIGNEKKGN
ncbi:hypothetical protein DS745_02720 [Anaerobacillus alkaliphilus]|uniref:Cytoplasmic protein n=1 Tax=Anaerobacillus alkaliphilus TaxID=1548597 RepID=A0A4Q0VX42_9BACI|nr:hypothetical protein [Anaerobacillus alkaliphilus]RXJ04317.1 hypothetical protein DS745_02720 [Anaerobacillus alkaliphilus]